jgi:RNA polymerase sigma factor (sigma-70 family)
VEPLAAVAGDDEQMLLQFIPAAGLNQEEVLIEREKMRKLNQALRRLSSRQRLIFIIRHDEGKSLEEIAEILDLEVQQQNALAG